MKAICITLLICGTAFAIARIPSCERNEELRIQSALLLESLHQGNEVTMYLPNGMRMTFHKKDLLSTEPETENP